jgi:apolipoprotein N-acyltransferase
VKALIGALASAALFGVAARVHWPSQVAALVALAPWLAGVDRVRPRVALASAAVLAIGVMVSSFWWLPAAIAAYTHISLLLAWLFALALAPLLLQPQFLAACAARLLARRSEVRPAAIAAITVLAYIGAEWALPKPLGDTIGIGLFPSSWLRQAAEIGGPRALTAICLAVSECVAAAAATPVTAAVAVIAAAGLYGMVRVRSVEAAAREAPIFSAGVVQAAITAYDKLAAEQGTYETVRQIVGAHVALSEELLRAGPLDLLIWPETVYPTTFGAPKSDEGAEFDREIAALPARTGVPLIFGAFENGGAGEHNAAFFLGVDGQVQTYRKSVLFPFTERVPGPLDSPRLRAALPWTGRWTPGPGARAIPLRVRGGAMIRFAPLICYEAVHPGYAARAVRDGAEVLLTLSNDAWFADPAAPRLHLAAAALRSVELRLPQIRATNSGISALVLPSGAIVSATRFGTRVALRLAVPRVPRSWTPSLAWGDWLGPAALGVCAVLALYSIVGTATNRRARSLPPDSAQSR